MSCFFFAVIVAWMEKDKEEEEAGWQMFVGKVGEEAEGGRERGVDLHGGWVGEGGMLASQGEAQSGWVRWGGRRWDGGGQRCWKRRRLKGG